MNTSTFCITGLIALIPVSIMIRVWRKVSKEVDRKETAHGIIGLFSGHRYIEKK